MTDPDVTMSAAMTENGREQDESLGAVPEAEEPVEGLPVLAEVRTLEHPPAASLPAVQAVAAMATGFVAGAATIALVRWRGGRKVARSGRATPRRAADVLPVVASRTFLVDIHVIGRAEQ